MQQTLDNLKRHPLEKGWHTPVSSPHLFIDGCVQIWPDTDFACLNKSGASAYVVTAFHPHAGFEAAIDAMSDWWRVARTYPEVRLALTSADILEAKRRGQAALIIGTQGADFIGQTLSRLEVAYRMGLRIVIPAYNERNSLCDGQLEPGNAGLSKLGRRFVEECNRLGLLIDLTHVGERSTFEIMDLTRQPVVFTHSNPKVLVNQARNITDEQMKRCAALGGVVGLTNWGPLNFKPDATSRPTLAMYLGALRYAVDLVGPDHVAIGTDFSHGTYPDGDLIRAHRNTLSGDRYAQFVDGSPRSRLRYCEGFDDYGQMPAVAEAMSKHGFSDAEIEKIFGGNLLRVFKAVWGA